MEHEDDTTPLRLDDGTESGSRTASLIVMSGGSIGRMFYVKSDELTLGRKVGADIRLEDEGISREHATITRHADGTTSVRDLDSRNGTFVNMKRVGEALLEDGDKIQLGAITILKFSLQSALEERFQRKLYDSATRDALTTAYNRRFFDEQIAKDFSHSRRHKTPLSLLMIDVDHFKRVNDEHGHLVGDAVLKRLGELVHESIRLEDVFCRIGGEEFSVIMRESGVEQALQFGERIRSVIASTQLNCGGVELSITVSAGAAAYDPDVDMEVSGLVERADRALYDAKHGGRNRVCASK